MDRFEPGQAQHFIDKLVQREAQLRALLGHPAREEAATHEVTDFKDAAAQESQAAIDEAQASHARHELEQVLLARHRLAEHGYGYCVDCGEPVALGRLEALPATAYCTSCQGRHEHAHP